MNNEPLVSIIIPVYNVEKYLPECLDSIINQTYSNLEIILVDDGSPDKCGEICDKYAVSDLRIKVIHKENGGVSSARNAGMDISTGEWISFIDSDDTIEKEMISEAISTVLKDKTDMCILDYDKIYDNRNYKNVKYISEKTYIYDNEDIITYFKKICMCNFIVKSCKIINAIRFNDDINLGEDLLFEFQIYGRINSFSYLNKVMYHYRIIRTSAMGSIALRRDYPEMIYCVYENMIKSISYGIYPQNACIIPNSLIIRFLGVVVRIAFKNCFSLKCDYNMIKKYMNTDEYRKAKLNYDRRLLEGYDEKLYSCLKKPNRFIITLIYLLSKIKEAITGKSR